MPPQAERIFTHVNHLAYRPDIDGLRALAVLGVIGYHLNARYIPGGFLGVDVFFVISGYLISLIILRERARGTFSIAGFYSRRIRRLFPALLLVLSAVLTLGYFALFSDEYQRVGEHARAAMLFVLNFRLMQEAGYFDVAANNKPLLHLWSLSVEEQFYLIWPALLILLQRLRVNIGMALGALFTLSLVFALWYGQRHVDQVFFHPFARTWQLAAGALIASWHFSRSPGTSPTLLSTTWHRESVAWVSLLMIAWGFWGVGHHIAFPNAYSLAPVLGTAGLILTKDAYVNKLLSSKPVVWIGLISYPLYLWHWPLLSYVRIMESGAPPEWLLFGAVGVAFLLSWLTYRLAERPMRLSPNRRPIVAFLVSTSLILLAVDGVIAKDGLPDRPSVSYVKKAESQMKRESRQDESCLVRFPEGEAPVYCRQHKPGPKMIAIIGDSHAHVLFPGVSELAETKGYGTLLLANSGCPPLQGAVTGRTQSERARCNEKIEKILSSIEKDARLKVVLIASRGPQYLTGEGFGPAEASYNYPPIAAWPKPRHTAAAPYAAFGKGLARTVERLLAKGLRVGYLLQVPELGVSSKECLGRPMVLVGPESGCRVPYPVYKARMSAYRELVKNMGEQIPSLRIIDVQSSFCHAGFCTGYIRPQLLYADDNHLSVLGSRRVAPLILRQLGL